MFLNALLTPRRRIKPPERGNKEKEMKKEMKKVKNLHQPQPKTALRAKENVMKTMFSFAIVLVAVITLAMPDTALAGHLEKMVAAGCQSSSAKVSMTKANSDCMLDCGAEDNPASCESACKGKVTAAFNALPQCRRTTVVATPQKDPKTPPPVEEKKLFWAPPHQGEFAKGSPELNDPCPEGTHVKGKGKKAYCGCDTDDSVMVKLPATAEICPSDEMWIAYFGEDLKRSDPRVHGFCPADTHLGEGDQPSCLCNSDESLVIKHPATGSACPSPYWAKILDYLGTPSSLVDLGLLLSILGIFLVLWNDRRKWACSCGTENSVLSKKCAHCGKPRPPRPGAPVPCPLFASHPHGKPGTKCPVEGCDGIYPMPPEMAPASSGITREEMRETVEAIADSRIPEAIAEELSPILAALEAGDMVLVAEELTKLKLDNAELVEAGLDEDGEGNK